MKKHYVIKDNEAMEWFDPDDYYSDFDAEQDRIWIGGNKEFIEMNSAMREKAADLESLYWEVDDVVNDPDAGYSKEGRANEVLNLVRDRFKYDDGRELSPGDCLEVLKLSKLWLDEPVEAMAGLMSVMFGEPFETTVLSGYGQGEWVKCVYPKALSKRVEYAEAVYFGTGASVKVSCDMHESAEEALEADDWYYDYFPANSDAKIIEHVAESQGCKIEEVAIIED